MINWVLSSSVLILGILLIRALFQGKMKKKVQYCLWSLVLLRLLIPFNIGHSVLSIANFRQEGNLPEPQIEETIEVRHDTFEDVSPELSQKNEEITAGKTEEIQEAGKASKSLKEWISSVLIGVWMIGGLAVGGMFLSTNQAFSRRLKISRHELILKRCPLPVYISNRIESPCLFGFLHPAVYVTGEVAADQTMLRHTLAHELCHYRHKDHIWAALRGLCLVIHWYNPLVWVAAILFQRDGEMACDEGTIRSLGEAERKEYGKTLIRATCQKSNHLLTAATTMTSDKKVLQQRLSSIVQKPQNAAAAIVAVVLLAAVFVGCTFTGARNQKSPEAVTPDGKPIDASAWEGILFEDESFYSSDFNKDMTLRSYEENLNANMEQALELKKYALADLDSDGESELILNIAAKDDSAEYGLLILHRDGEKAIGISQSMRQMMNVKQDGTFQWSGGASNHGSARAVFEGNTIRNEDITWIEDDGQEVRYFADGKPVDEKTFQEAETAQEAKPNVWWIEIGKNPEDIPAVETGVSGEIEVNP